MTKSITSAISVAESNGVCGLRHYLKRRRRRTVSVDMSSGRDFLAIISEKFAMLGAAKIAMCCTAKDFPIVNLLVS